MRSSRSRRTTLSREETFRDLVQQWHRATDHLSFLEPVLTHPAYLRIIGLGPVVAPLLLRELKARPDYWFPALAAVTGEDPVRLGATFDEAVEDWLTWGCDVRRRAGTAHARSRQLATGHWTSKLGRLEDITHETLEALEESDYGRVARVMRRPRRSGSEQPNR